MKKVKNTLHIIMNTPDFSTFKDYSLVIENGIISENFIIEMKEKYPDVENDLLILLNYMISKTYPKKLKVEIGVINNRFSIEVDNKESSPIYVTYYPIEKSENVCIIISYFRFLTKKNNIDLHLFDTISKQILQN